MKTTKVLFVLLATLGALLFGCGQRGEARRTDAKTETILPATPPPDNTQTDSAMTQTVEIGEDRSSNEGGVLSEGETSTETTTTAQARKAVPPGPKPKR